MKKTATILFWISLALEVIYLVVAVVIVICSGMFNTTGQATEGATYVAAVVQKLLMIGGPLLLQLIFSLVTIFSMKGHSEKIIMEIIAIILFSGVLGIVNVFLNAAMNQIAMNVVNDINYLVMTSNSGIVSFIGSVGRTLFLLANAFAIAYKKVEMVDLRRIQEEQDV
ncbi:MAG: hypothetical protein IJZ42_12775 [Lachnospiraceae bacterium]|nr:hypothetical protein [Lachnospiraceae bacterium]